MIEFALIGAYVKDATTERVRVFEVDTLEPDWQPVLATPMTIQAEAWRAVEEETLGRYLECWTD